MVMMIVHYFLFVLPLVLAVTASASDTLFFSETFDVDPFETGLWELMEHEKYANQVVKVKPANNPAKGFEHDKGIVFVEGMRHYGFGTKFKNPLKMKNQIVIQYDVKLFEHWACGGGYVKLIPDSPDFEITTTTHESLYIIMFGPDKCDRDNKVHFILNYKHPVTLKWTEHHLINPPVARLEKNKLTHLYTLVIRKNNIFEIFIDQKVVKKGSLLKDLDPPINPPQYIDDATDIKPVGWVDQAFIEDVAATKPDDWDESEPQFVPDLDAVKPEFWDESVEPLIIDIDHPKPENWNETKDGVWEPVMMRNRECFQGKCGKWNPMKRNPNFKGKWTRPFIPNPAFKGVWKPNQIPNPLYFEDLTPALTMPPMGGMIMDVWTSHKGTYFDNFVISHSLNKAFKFANATTEEKMKIEERHKKKSRMDVLKMRREAADARRVYDEHYKWKDLAKKQYEELYAYPNENDDDDEEDTSDSAEKISKEKMIMKDEL